MDKLAFGSVAAAAGLPSLPRQLVVAGLEAPAWDGAEAPTSSSRALVALPSASR